ncbi:outer membrane protein [Pontivivens insulae]|uniref:Outer membrane protein beta-barrel domain-containing protein n=1 Tax=Pontivivens insulae TaxID=1639689 RepID=A0A2R8A723_9RHOB|nr:outer membrane beta-barrel protein [Pontivivens insulae]RED17931.1 outer membrane protein with beta-barrel domain [Pontivivens insulae]SPF27820.1 hypothetical protein POI8812_00115 [Pontivivens insulae]
MKNVLLSATVLTALTAAPALAGGFGSYSGTGDWTGPSVGLQFGNIDADTSGAAASSGDDDIYGLTAYYDYDFGSFILGGGIELDRTDLALRNAAGATIATIDSVERFALRGGIDGGRNFYYVTAGVADVETSAGAAAPGDSSGSFYGIGYEVFITDLVTASAKALRHDFDSFAINGLEAEATTIQLGLNMRF